MFTEEIIKSVIKECGDGEKSLTIQAHLDKVLSDRIAGFAPGRKCWDGSSTLDACVRAGREWQETRHSNRSLRRNKLAWTLLKLFPRSPFDDFRRGSQSSCNYGFTRNIAKNVLLIITKRKSSLLVLKRRL